MVLFILLIIVRLLS
ncbi:hypothetical protein [Lysinibacillus fusiformis]